MNRPSQALREAISAGFTKPRRKVGAVRQAIAAAAYPADAPAYRRPEPETSDQAIARGVRYEVLPSAPEPHRDTIPCRFAFRGRGSQG